MENSETQLRAIIKGARAILEKDSFDEAARAIFDRCCELTGAISGCIKKLYPEYYDKMLLDGDD